jgi:hypothetical protein
MAFTVVLMILVGHRKLAELEGWIWTASLG